jgi:hypothetical protein
MWLLIVGIQHYPLDLLAAVGNVLVNAPEKPDGLWIHPVIAKAMNSKERSDLRDGYSTGIYNSRGVLTTTPKRTLINMTPTATKHKAQEVMLGLLNIQRFLFLTPNASHHRQ